MALGRGLGELLVEVGTSYEKSINYDKSVITKIEVSKIQANPKQPRKVFDEKKLKELSESIKEHGLLQPIIVVKEDENKYILVSGERRLRAHKLAKLDTIDTIILDIDELKLRELALIENIQRDDLNIIEIAHCYEQLITEHNITHEELSNKVFKSRTSITNTLRLLQLIPYVQDLISNDKLTAGHAKIMTNLSQEQQRLVADSIIGQKLSVRQTEELVRNIKNDNKPKNDKKSYNFDFKPLGNIINKLQDSNLKVKAEKNYLKIEIKSQEDIEKLLHYFS